ncbi:ABC transporter substrate-binding protein [Nonomuraea sp. NPDC050153]|uniref:ABC transporter substrate-binding protein n=1 Tax=Nonomuraea sp. NPDC050153 TaxID=3364359 RepID=UPI0037A546F1
MDDAPMYIGRIWPHPRRFPRRLRHWWRLAAVVTALGVLVPVGLIGVPWLKDRLSCGWQPWWGVWEQGGECVGLGDGPYAFGRPELTSVMGKIAQQNEAAADGSCAKDTKAVTVGALMTLTSAEGGGRVLHQLEGIVAGQASANANKAECVHPIRLRVAHMGADEQAAVETAELLAEDGVVAVVGMGLSLQQTADAARVLAQHRIPMMGNVITAEGFDGNGSQQDNPDFRRCNPSHTYKNGIGQGYFSRVAYRNAVQIEQLAKYLEPSKKTLKFVMTPITMDDPYTCTTLPLVHARFGSKSRPLQEVKFDSGDSATVKQSAQRICASAGPVSVFYAARASHLAQFLKSIADQSDRGQCQFTSITVVSTSDAARMRAKEVDPNLEQQRVAALGTPTFLDGTVRLVYTPLADPDLLPKNGGMAVLRQSFATLGFDLTHLTSGWAIAGFDGMAAVAGAVNTLTAREPVTSSRVNTALGGFVRGGAAVAGASGNITFDNYGNRDDSVPSVVRLCPVKGAEPHTVKVHPAETPCGSP